MEASLDIFTKRLSRPWLADEKQAEEFAKVALIPSSSDGPVVLSTANRILYLAQLFSALMQRRDVFLGNASWGEYEWGQVNALIALWDGGGKDGRIMIPTGGTGGKIKFAVHDWETLMASVRGYAAYWGGGELHAICPLPVCHIGGLMLALRTFMTGGQLWVADPKLEKLPPPDFDVANAHLSLVGAQLRWALDNDVAWLRECEAVLVGGGPTDKGLIEESLAAGIPLYIAYGLTEAAATVALAKASPNGGIPAADVLPHWKLSVDGEEICLSGEALFRGYWGGGSPEGAWKTGDRGQLENGKLRVLGRMGRYIITGGKKVDAALLESRLLEWAEISDALVMGCPHRTWGEEVVAFVVSTKSEPELKALAKDRLMPEMRPKAWFCLEQVPLTENGKPDRAALYFLMKRT
ncbi:AMP-binding protein [Cerasicoccus arenae]|uniref:O-succinylbenzoic acid--CoA ligase n=1 Tax=Cerasicoccus arenae TaxID=424488 RepID=A0A8J3DES9_9BACT|nr:AMP-binding protein [Cerasicoccus arenae]MBK1857109.1 AMP-binding protein [Cerasicoccus arenae]GHB92415.1 O-succinylbenzoic acid--CoA ligase [Cerasicoccus arenae]